MRLDKAREYVGNYMSRLVEMAESSSFAFVIWHLSLMMALWGTWLILPLGTFAGGPYQAMNTFASEFAWGLMALGMGLGKMHFVAAKKVISLSMLCLISGYLWIFVGVSFLFAVPSNTGGMVYLMLGLIEFWFYKRLQSRNTET